MMRPVKYVWAVAAACLGLALAGCPQSGGNMKQTKSDTPALDELADQDAEAFEQQMEPKEGARYRRRVTPHRRGRREQPHGGGVPR